VAPTCAPCGSPQAASRSVRPFLQSSPVRPTHRYAHRRRKATSIYAYRNSPHLATLAVLALRAKMLLARSVRPRVSAVQFARMMGVTHRRGTVIAITMTTRRRVIPPTPTPTLIAAAEPGASGAATIPSRQQPQLMRAAPPPPPPPPRQLVISASGSDYRRSAARSDRRNRGGRTRQ